MTLAKFDSVKLLLVCAIQGHQKKLKTERGYEPTLADSELYKPNGVKASSMYRILIMFSMAQFYVKQSHIFLNKRKAPNENNNNKTLIFKIIKVLHNPAVSYVVNGSLCFDLIPWTMAALS